jgi:hypothetical protein
MAINYGYKLALENLQNELSWEQPCMKD